MDKRMTRSQAITTASRYGLAREAAHLMDHENLSPEEALSQLDIL